MIKKLITSLIVFLIVGPLVGFASFIGIMKLTESPRIYPPSPSNFSLDSSSPFSFLGIVLLVYGFGWVPSLIAGFLYNLEVAVIAFILKQTALFQKSYAKKILGGIAGGLAGFLSMVFFEFLLSTGSLHAAFHPDIWKNCSMIAGIVCGIVATVRSNREG